MTGDSEPAITGLLPSGGGAAGRTLSDLFVPPGGNLIGEPHDVATPPPPPPPVIQKAERSGKAGTSRLRT
jgi:hypothetical protein